MAKHSKVTIGDFIKFREQQRHALEAKRPNAGSIKHWFYLSGQIDAAKLIKKTFTIK
jgi:hypothetical protein